MIIPDYKTFKSPYELYHYGTKRHSGRYPWGSGERPYQSEKKSGGDYKLKKYTTPTIEDYKSVSKSVLSTFAYRAALVSIAKAVYDTFQPSASVANVMAYSALLGPWVISTLKDRIESDKYEKAKNANFNNPDVEKRLKNIPKKEKASIEEDMKNVNPRIKDPGGTSNCVNCTLAMELRRRGYDVEARLGEPLNTSKVLKESFKSSPQLFHTEDLIRKDNETRKQYIKRSYNETLNRMEKWGDGSRGFISIRFDREEIKIGHMMYWENTNGVVKIYDTQHSSDDVSKIYSLSDPKQTIVGRWDNVELKDDCLKYIMNKKGK